MRALRGIPEAIFRRVVSAIILGVGLLMIFGACRLAA